MPIHDWTLVSSGLFHAFHQGWTVRIADALNGRLPKGYYALVEQRIEGPEPDVIAVETKRDLKKPAGTGSAVLLPPQTSLLARAKSDAVHYAKRANRITVRHPLGEVVAIVEVVSPGNKDSRHALRTFVDKAASFLRRGVHLLVVDLFPPSLLNPQGIHHLIWQEFSDLPFAFPIGKDRTLVSYQADDEWVAFIEPLAVNDPMPDMPLFIAPGEHVLTPLESTYQETWAVCPEPIRQAIEPA